MTPPKKRAPASDIEKNAMTLIDEAFSLLRGHPGLIVWHWIGSAPFLIALLYFWADMTWSPEPRERLAGGSLLVGALFLWMKMWQVEFMRRARGAIMSAGPGVDARWTARRFATALSIQSVTQPPPYLIVAVFVFFAMGGMAGMQAMPSGGAILLMALPFALMFLFCMGWMQGFFTAALVEGDGRSERLRDVIAASARQVFMWPKQTYGLMTWSFFFGVVVFINWLALIMMTPTLIRMFTGIHTAYTDKAWAMFNPTTFAASAALTALSLDPVVKLAFALRFFYVESQTTGRDLIRELRLIEAESGDGAPRVETAESKPVAGRGRSGATAALAALLWLAASAGPASRAGAQGEPAAREIIAPERVIRPGELGDSIRETMSEREFAWRRARGGEGDGQMNPFFEFLESVAERIGDALKAVVEWIKDLLDRRESVGGASSGWLGGMSGQRAVMYALVAVGVTAIVLFIVRATRGRRVQVEAIAPEATPQPDLTKEDVDAKSLPVNEWLELARKLAGEGNARLALRAVYLATLAALGERQLIRIARHKTNKEYQREIGRRGHAEAAAALAELFARRVLVFEGAWYGRHEVGEDELREAMIDYERIQTLAAQI